MDPTQLGRQSGDALQDILSIARKMKSDISDLGAEAGTHLGCSEARFSNTIDGVGSALIVMIATISFHCVLR